MVGSRAAKEGAAAAMTSTAAENKAMRAIRIFEACDLRGRAMRVGGMDGAKDGATANQNLLFTNKQAANSCLILLVLLNIRY